MKEKNKSDLLRGDVREADDALSVRQKLGLWLKAIWVTLLGRDLERIDPQSVVPTAPRAAPLWRPLTLGGEPDVPYATTVLEGTVVHGVTLPFDTLSPLFTDTVVEYLATRPFDTRTGVWDRAA